MLRVAWLVAEGVTIFMGLVGAFIVGTLIARFLGMM
jgi:hypothetical protein